MATAVAPTATAVETRIPAMPPPSGMASNFDHPQTLAHKNYIAISIALPFVIVPFVFRCYVRLWRKRVWIFEDCKFFLSLTLTHSHNSSRLNKF